LPSQPKLKWTTFEPFCLRLTFVTSTKCVSFPKPQYINIDVQLRLIREGN